MNRRVEGLDRHEDSRKAPDGAGKSRLPLWISLSILGTLVVLYFASPAFQREIDEGLQALRSGEQQRVSSWVRDFGAWGPIAIVGAMTAQMFLIVIPSVVLIVVSVLAYGTVPGSLLAAGSVLVASAVGYWIGSGLGPVTVDRMIGRKQEETLEDYIERYGFWTVVVVRMSPVLSNDAISFVGGLLRMGFAKFMLATTAGIAPLVILVAYLGESTDQIESVLLWISGVSAVALVGYIVYDRKTRKNS